MTATAHALVAGAIASKIPDPLAAAALALASHFIMDSVPHWDFGTNWRNRPKSITGILAIAETVIGMSVAYLVFGGKVELGLLLITVVASLIPDWLETPWYIFFANKNKKEPTKNAEFLEKLCFNIYKTENVFHTKASFPFGVITQVATVAFFLLLLR